MSKRQSRYPTKGGLTGTNALGDSLDTEADEQMITAGTLSTSLIDDGEAVKRPVDEFNWNLLPSSLTGLRQGPIEIGAGNPNVRRLHVFDNLRRPVVGPALSSSAKSDGQGRRSDAAREAGRTPRGDLSATSASEAARSRMGLKRRREM